MTAPLEHWDTCNVCMAIRVAEEAEAGLRCRTCLTSFEKPYPVESAEHPGFCNPCGTTEPYREPWEAAPASTESDRKADHG